jgi:hypothetical protein
MLRHPPVRALVGLIVGFVAAYGTFYVVDQFGQREESGRTVQTSVGEVDFEAYCGALPGELRAVLTRRDPTGWRCIGATDGFYTSLEVDLVAACRTEFGDDAEARLADADDPASWECVSPGSG